MKSTFLRNERVHARDKFLEKIFTSLSFFPSSLSLFFPFYLPFSLSFCLSHDCRTKGCAPRMAHLCALSPVLLIISRLVLPWYRMNAWLYGPIARPITVTYALADYARSRCMCIVEDGSKSVAAARNVAWSSDNSGARRSVAPFSLRHREKERSDRN